MGISLPGWVPDYYRLKKKKVLPMLEDMVNNGEIKQVEIKGWKEPALYIPEQEELLDSAIRGTLQATHTTLLSPFDPLTWDRQRLRQLFGMNFMIQSYTPATDRTFGYFPLPILHRGSLIGRLDAKAHRKDKRFEIKGFYLEPEINPDNEMMSEVIAAVKSCAAWHKTPEVVAGNDIPRDLRDQIFAEL
jgi:uncharacterized protein YcaQ